MHTYIGDTHFEYIDYYPSEFVLNNKPDILLSEPSLTHDNIMKFKQGIGQEWPIELVENSINTLIL